MAPHKQAGRTRASRPARSEAPNRARGELSGTAKFEGWTAESARNFCAEWLAAWTGNDPERLLEYYTDDAFYSDPAVPSGLTGKEQLRPYFTRLLARYPEWVWEHRRSLPLPTGFLNFWDARLTSLSDAPRWSGVCVVQFRDGVIYRNEVFMDLRALPASQSR